MTKADRNGPCTCGSGKKFKKCCGLPKQRKLSNASVISSGSLSSIFRNSIQKGEEEKGERSPIVERISAGAITK